MKHPQEVKSIVGVVGLGLMGSSIVVALLASGYKVIAVAPVAGEAERASVHIREMLLHADKAGLLKDTVAAGFEAMTLCEDYAALSNCAIVLECVVENKEIKSTVYKKIAAAVARDVIIASNTSAIPISELQELVPGPERFVGIHWAEPAYMTRFLEVTCGSKTDVLLAEQAVALGVSCNKEPTLLKKDIRGFITNRLMYAVYREALTLVEQGHTSISDADKAFRYDAGAWMTLMGIFRRMDFMGTDEQMEIYSRLFNQLSNRSDVPLVMQRLAEKGARGVHDLDGLYTYTAEEARIWQAAFVNFNEAIYQLAIRYSEQNNLKNNEDRYQGQKQYL
ncbi:MAG TPA: 3-hydroxyacyl-CoA dehydrogenase family protein [Niabella sp.]